MDLDDPAVSSQNDDVVDKIVDATNYGLAYAGEKIKEVDGNKAVKGAAYLGACAGVYLSSITWGIVGRRNCRNLILAAD
ncbi:hypothetical protein [Methanococcoides alaskense]|uniref:Uncharacterized protein n=1 Tax=Methanococcoides alaskense TaxID=325778 RepID=A0AA90TX63_9EURY|nr:hypothetical protein [Methanococcoides alaskense]MDA0525428.1 hypothetical protein [Methanococcoides alaskense]MDR6221639.1 hypothetical protein [Methanococcoides alaskense]